MINCQRSHIYQQGEKIKQQESQLKEKDMEINQKDKQLSEKDTIIESLKEVIQDKSRIQESTTLKQNKVNCNQKLSIISPDKILGKRQQNSNPIKYNEFDQEWKLILDPV